MIGSAIAEYNVAISYELHWLFLLDFKWSFLLVYVWLFSPGSNRSVLNVNPGAVLSVNQYAICTLPVLEVNNPNFNLFSPKMQVSIQY